MPNSFEGLAVIALALVPGLLATLAYEQWAGRSGRAFADRTFRLITVSAIAVVITAWPLYLAWDRFVVSRDIAQGRPLPWWTWLALVAWVVLPWYVGTRVGRAAKERRRWVQALTGPAPEPRAWDHLFNARSRTGWVRIRLLDGSWIFGAWSHPEHQSPSSGDLRAYAAGYPDEQDLFLPETFEIDDDGYGLFESEEDDDPIPRGVALLVRWSEVRYLEYIDRPPRHPAGEEHGASAADTTRPGGRLGEEGWIPGGTEPALSDGAATSVRDASAPSPGRRARAQLSRIVSAVGVTGDDVARHHAVHPRALSDIGLITQGMSAQRSVDALRAAQGREYALVPVCASLAVALAAYSVATLTPAVGPHWAQVVGAVAAGALGVLGMAARRSSRRLGADADRAANARDAYEVERHRRAMREAPRRRRGTMPTMTRLSSK